MVRHYGLLNSSDSSLVCCGTKNFTRQFPGREKNFRFRLTRQRFNLKMQIGTYWKNKQNKNLLSLFPLFRQKSVQVEHFYLYEISASKGLTLSNFPSVFYLSSENWKTKAFLLFLLSTDNPWSLSSLLFMSALLTQSLHPICSFGERNGAWVCRPQLLNSITVTPFPCHNRWSVLIELTFGSR